MLMMVTKLVKPMCKLLRGPEAKGNIWPNNNINKIKGSREMKSEVIKGSYVQKDKIRL